MRPSAVLLAALLFAACSGAGRGPATPDGASFDGASFDGAAPDGASFDGAALDGASFGDNPFGAFHFGLEDRPPEAQVAFLDAIGFRGQMIWFRGEAELRQFGAAPAVRAGRVRLLAASMEVDPAAPVDRAAWAVRLQALAETGTSPWILVAGPKDRPSVVADRLGEIADLARPFGIVVVIAPHDGYAIASAEESLAVLALANRANLKTSLHLCHELKAGNKDRLGAVVAAALPHLALASLHGAHEDGDRTPGWARAIVPLDRGDFDVEGRYLRPLLEQGYAGPILLHTAGIEEPPEQHFRRSFARYREMIARLGAARGR